MSTSFTEFCRRYVDGILIINMDSSPERYAAVSAAMAGVLPEERTERLSAVVGRELPGYGKAPWFAERTGTRAKAWAGAAGCALSHRKGIALARERGWKSVLLLEDDVRAASAESAAPLLEHVMESCRGACMFYLGYNRPVPHGSCLMQQGDYALWQVDGVLATHAYIVTAEAYDTLLAVLPTEENVWEWLARYRAIDTFYREYVAAGGMLPVYAVYPPVMTQADGVSDITDQAVAGNSCACEREPYRMSWLYRACLPFRRLKVRLNSLRTLMRARRGGLPGPRQRRR